MGYQPRTRTKLRKAIANRDLRYELKTSRVSVRQLTVVLCCFCSSSELGSTVKLKENPAPYMGEVRTKVRLFNNAEANAAAEGKLAAEKVRVIEAEAMVDTGAVRSCIPASLLEQLGIRRYDRVTVEHADGSKRDV